MSVPVLVELMESSETHSNSYIHQQWEFCGHSVPKSEIVFFAKSLSCTLLLSSVFLTLPREMVTVTCGLLY